MPVRGNCTICTDFFGVEQDISVTFCGHLFHEACLSQWLKQCGSHRTCPQCRTKLSAKQVVSKLYINVPEVEEEEMDPFFLRNELNEYQSRERKLKDDKKKLKDTLKQYYTENENLTKSRKRLEKDLENSKQSNDFLKDQLKIAKGAEDDMVQARNEAKRLRERLKTCEKMECILEAGKTQTDEIIQQYACSSNASSAVKELATFCNALKQEYETLKESRNRAKDEAMKSKRDIHRLKQQLLECETTSEHLQENINSLHKTEEHLIGENKSLRKKLEALQSAISSPSDVRSSAISRLLSESPAPVHLTPGVTAKYTKRLSSENELSFESKKPKLCAPSGDSGFVELDDDSKSSFKNGSFICEPSTSGMLVPDKNIHAMKEKNTESPNTVNRKKFCEEMGFKYVKISSSLKAAPVVKSNNEVENALFRKPQLHFGNSRVSKHSFRSNKVPMSSKAKPFSSKPVSASSLRPKTHVLKKAGPR